MLTRTLLPLTPITATYRHKKSLSVEFTAGRFAGKSHTYFSFCARLHLDVQRAGCQIGSVLEKDGDYGSRYHFVDERDAVIII